MRSNFNAAVSLSLAMTLGAIGTSTEALASGRHVVVNGNLMNATQLSQLDSAHCERIPDGSYFLTQMANGAWVWGYAALPGIPQGYLGENCQGTLTQGVLGGETYPTYPNQSSGQGKRFIEDEIDDSLICIRYGRRC